jgi:hypothetical protein
MHMLGLTAPPLVLGLSRNQSFLNPRRVLKTLDCLFDLVDIRELLLLHECWASDVAQSFTFEKRGSSALLRHLPLRWVLLCLTAIGTLRTKNWPITFDPVCECR